jgi:UDP-N-acetylglucosamine 4,6-dehydratase (inverting)
MDLNGARILITGGTGSFGRQFVSKVLCRFPQVERLVVFSRDELKQYEMAQTYSEQEYPAIRYFIGDIRDRDRLWHALEGIDIVVHAAALKHVPICEYNPFEAIKTNILGAQNLIEVCIAREVKQVVALSTDKAAAPINLYGATKLVSDKLFAAANYARGKHDIRFSIVRYGNVMGSRGSVIPFFLKMRETGVLPITDPRMTRFNITLEESFDLVMRAFDLMWGGEIFVPKTPSFRIMDVAEAVAPGCEVNIIGIRPGEKLHEELITNTDGFHTVEFPNHYVILPTLALWDLSHYLAETGSHHTPEGFRYSSDANTEWLTVDEIRRLIRHHIDPSFDVQGH